MDTVVWDRVVTLHGMVSQRLAKEMQRRHGIGMSEYQALCQLVHADDGELRMQELAELVGLNQSSVSRLVARLESAGLTQRDLCPKDRRGVYTVITEQGRALHAKAEPTYRKAVTEALNEAAADNRLTEFVAELRA
ncbi:MarR family winged helix-turn-helix transcriptional regulator [Nocardia pseudobrasiliensis]|uniref:DNA-binding MarR family transcriptional regulator n=1 Tax=Nocardia pseudobrasiliensis TaxID=45979 RepID=A0A370HX24_9NOCA|nr:MarR family transcriptional regulator [Nocardia pseudobrasiliensis]RDI63066.1 DNA-binding MarR family transcriptional regulator [Nocardia pseudobrasiliensis]